VEANMVEADLRGARMEGANLINARMGGATLIGAQMDGAVLALSRLEGADFTSASLHGAALRDVDFEGVEIDQDQLINAFGDGSVSLPEDWDWPSHWPREVLDKETYFGRWRGWRERCGMPWPVPGRALSLLDGIPASGIRAVPFELPDGYKCRDDVR
ncbi:MAG: pentapeptide repeat-containing protein, partial [Pseudomonadota bacterium]